MNDAPDPKTFAPLLHLQRGGASLEELRHAVSRAAAMNFGGLVVEIESGFADDAESLRVVARACREYSLSLRLHVGDMSRIENVSQNAIEVPHAQSLFFATYEVTRGDFSAWSVPPHAGEVLEIIAVPLTGDSRAPRWNETVSLRREYSQNEISVARDDTPSSSSAENDNSPRVASLETLRENVAARLYLMTARDDALASTRDAVFYLDALDARATQNAIAHHLAPLREALGELWPQVVEIIAAPPHAHRVQEVASPESELCFVWSRGFARTFQTLHGYDVISRLPSLIADSGEEAVRVRGDFHATVAHLTRENWWRILRAWARENGVSFSAAACENDAMARALESSGDAVTALENAETPLASRRQTNGESDFLHARLAASVAALREDVSGETDAREYSQVEKSRSVENMPRKNISSENTRIGNADLPRDLLFDAAAKNSRAPISSDESPSKNQTADFFASPDAARGDASCEYSHGDFGTIVRAEIWRGARFSTSLAARRRQAFSLLHAGVFSLEESAAQAALSLENSASTREAASVLVQLNAEAMADFNDELARLCQSLQSAKSGARVGVLWPARSLQAHYNPRGHRFTRWVEEDLRATAKLLDELHFDFLFLPEETLCEARDEECEKGATLLCGGAQLPLQLLVLPSVTALSRAAWEKVEAFVENGGRVVCLGLLPRWSERGRDEELESRIARATRFHLADAYDSYAATDTARLRNKSAPPVLSGGVGFPLAREYSSGGRLCCYQPRLNDDDEDAALVVRRMLMESFSPACETQERSVRVSRRELPDGGGDLFFVFNDGPARRINVRLRPSREGAPFLLDPKGDWKPLPVSMDFSGEEGGGLIISLEMAQGEAQLLRVQPDEALRVLAERANFQVETLDEGFARGYATESGTPQIALRKDARVVWQRGENLQVPPPLLLPDLWKARREAPNALRLFALQNRAAFSLPEEMPQLWLAMLNMNAPASTRAVRLNGVALTESASPFPTHELWREKIWRWFELSAARAGENVVETEGEASRLFLVGDFSLHREEDEFFWPEDGDFPAPETSQNALPTLVATRPLQLQSGAWSEQGLPHYVGICEYSQAVFAPRDWENCRVWLEVSSHENVIEVVVNGAACGVAGAPPFRFEITESLHFGEENTVALRVFGDASPALEEDAPPCGLNGVARIVACPRVEIAL